MKLKSIILISLLLFQRQKLSLFYTTLSLLVGVMSVFVVIETVEVLKRSIYQNGQKVFAADISISAYRKLKTNELLIVKGVLKNEMIQSQSIEFPSMIKPAKGSSFLANIKGVDEKYPLYGRVKLMGDIPFKPIGRQECYLDRELASQSKSVIGDLIQVGSENFRVAGIVREFPEQGFSGGLSFAPKMLVSVHSIEDTGLIQFGSRVRYKSYFAYAEIPRGIEEDLKLKSSLLKAKLDDPGFNIKTFKESEEFTKEILNQVTTFFMLAAYFVLILSLAGFGSSLYTFLSEQLKDVATLRCLGFHKNEVLAMFLFLFSSIGLLSGLLGILIGKLASFYIITWLESLLEINLSGVPFSIKALESVGFSVMLSLWVGYFGIHSFSKINGLAVFQNKIKQMKLSFTIQAMMLTGCLFIFWLYLWWSTTNKLNSLYIVLSLAGLMIATILLIKLIWLLLRFFYRFFSRSLHFDLALLELSRNQNKYLVFLLTLGLGSSALLALYFVESAFANRLSLEEEKKQPNVFCIGIQKNQISDIKQIIKNKTQGEFFLSPLIQARLKFINDISVNNIVSKLETMDQKRRLLSRTFRLTYTDKLDISQKVVSGSFWESNCEKAEISLEVGFAKTTNTVIGDQFTFNVQGKEIKGIVTSLRKVDWGTMQPNFFVIMPKRILENAPQFTIGSVYVKDDSDYLKLKDEIYLKSPNITLINISDLIAKVTNLFSYLSLALKSLFLLCMMMGVFILMSCLNRSQVEQKERHRTLRALGWHNKNIWFVEMLESLMVGMILSLLVSVFVIPVLWGLQKLLEMELSASLFEIMSSFLILLLFPFIGQELFRLFKKKETIR